MSLSQSQISPKILTMSGSVIAPGNSYVRWTWQSPRTTSSYRTGGGGFALVSTVRTRQAWRANFQCIKPTFLNLPRGCPIDESSTVIGSASTTLVSDSSFSVSQVIASVSSFNLMFCEFSCFLFVLVLISHQSSVFGGPLFRIFSRVVYSKLTRKRGIREER